jgi:hypothetical protein
MNANNLRRVGASSDSPHSQVITVVWLDETKSIGPQLAGVANDSSLHLGKVFGRRSFCAVLI